MRKLTASAVLHVEVYSEHAKTKAFIVTVGTASCTIRPKRSRRPEEAVVVSWDTIYDHAQLLAHHLVTAGAAKRRRRRVARGTQFGGR